MARSRVLHEDKIDIEKLFNAGAKVSSAFYHTDRVLMVGQFYVCGSSKVAIGVKGSLIELFRQSKGYSMEEAGAAFDRICKGRYATDIFE
jgi:hypothetical protein